MITVNSIIGNIYKDAHLLEKYRQMTNGHLSETLNISRMEAQRTRMRKTSDKGTDIALVLPHNTHLKHGDVLMLNEDKIVVLEIKPEKVAVIEVKNNIHSDHLVEIPVRIGHAIGNLHRPIKLEGNKIFFPIQVESELDIFRKLFIRIKENVDIRSATMVFEAEDGSEIHEH